MNENKGPLAQLVEQLPFKEWVAGSNPARLMSPSSSLVQDTALSRRKQGFKSPWGRIFFKEGKYMPNGKVKWFNPQKGYGFIEPEDGGKDVFVHISALEAAGIGNLNEGDSVSFEVVSENGKEKASDLKAI